MSSPLDLTDAFATHRGWLWGLGYRMLGSPADADDLVQDTFARALEAQPDGDRPLGPWLTRVAANLARDRLRRRRRRQTRRTWLPGPVPDDDLRLRAAPREAPDARYGLMEAATLAFLIALEELTPHQRAVLVLRDVFDLDGAETAAALDSTRGSVKVTLHRARRAMAGYDADRVQVDAATRRAAASLLGRFVTAVQAGDVDAVRALLTEDAVALSDGGSRYLAAGKPVRGADRIARMYVKLARQARTSTASAALVEVNGLPALLITDPDPPRGHAPLSVTQIRPRGDRICGIHAVLAEDRLTAVTSLPQARTALDPDRPLA